MVASSPVATTGVAPVATVASSREATRVATRTDTRRLGSVVRMNRELLEHTTTTYEHHRNGLSTEWVLPVD